MQTVLITGANSGIGKSLAILLAKRQVKVLLACRSFTKTMPVIDEMMLVGKIEPEWVELDLSSFTSIKNCAQTVIGKGVTLTCLVNNAGLAGKKGLTQNGFELAFGVNYLGHFLLTNLLLPTLKKTKNARIINVSSKVHHRTKKIEFERLRNKTRTLTGIEEYAVSKLANILFTAELHNKFFEKGISSFSVHPGLVDTEIWRGLPFFLKPILSLKGLLSPDQGAQAIMNCIFDVESKESGAYFSKSKKCDPSPLAKKSSLQKKLWDKSEAWIESYKT
jgi:NAD(P)-dependent dehydrogenase (short-subunit alcohol dehydrogenase family)